MTENRSAQRVYTYHHSFDKENIVTADNHKDSECEARLAANASLKIVEPEEWWNFKIVAYKVRNGLGKWENKDVQNYSTN